MLNLLPKNSKFVDETVIDKPSKQFSYKKTFPYILPVLWFFSLSLFTFMLTFVTILYMENSSAAKAPKYSIFSAKPMVLGSATSTVQGDDARAERIDKIFEKYNCPIQGHGQKFVEAADKNNIPYWLVAAVAFQESSCGKQTPKVEGAETYNLYGWGVWGEHVKQFDDLDHGIEVVSKYMYDMFYSKGVTEPCEIMKTYTPPSKGSWCAGVKFFRDEIREYESPSF